MSELPEQQQAAGAAAQPNDGLVLCHNRGAGCGWSGTYEDLAEHLRSGCIVTFSKCPKCGEPKAASTSASNTGRGGTCQCNAQSSRIQCPFCPVLLARSEVTAHIQQCRETKEQCPDCFASVLRAQLRKHKEDECGATLVPCPFSVPGFHERRKREAERKERLERRLRSRQEGTNLDEDEDYSDDEDEFEDEYGDDDIYRDLKGCEHDLLRRDEVRSHVASQAEAHLTFAISALKAQRSCLEVTRLDLDDEREARQRFQKRCAELEARVRTLEEEVSYLRQKLEEAEGDASEESTESEVDDIDLDADESVVQEELARMAQLLLAPQTPSATASSSSHSSISAAPNLTPEQARRQILQTLPPRKRMLANLLIQAQRQHVQEVRCAPNAHDDIPRSARSGRYFYSRSELLSMRRSVIDSLAHRDNYPDVGAPIYVENKEDRVAAQSALTSTTENAAAIALARLRSNKQQLLQQVKADALKTKQADKKKKQQQQSKTVAPIIMGAALNDGKGIGKGLHASAEPVEKLWLKKGKEGKGGRGRSQETIIDTSKAIKVDYYGNKVNPTEQREELPRAAKPWVPRSRQAKTEEPAASIPSELSSAPPAPAPAKPGELTAEEKTAASEASRIFRGMLNKVTDANIPNFAEKLWATALGPLARAEQVEYPLETLFEKAVAEPAFTAIYARLFKALVRHPNAHAFEQYVPATSDKPESKVSRTLHWVLISRCRREFEAAFKAQMDALDASTSAAANEGSHSDPDAKKARLIGVLRFLGELYKNEQLLDVIMFACVDRLLAVVVALVSASPAGSTAGVDPAGNVSKEHKAKIEVLIEEITALLQSILPTMVLATSERSQLPPAKRDELRVVLDGQKARLHELAENPVLTKRAKILLLNLFDQCG